MSEKVCTRWREEPERFDFDREDLKTVFTWTHAEGPWEEYGIEYSCDGGINWEAAPITVDNNFLMINCPAAVRVQALAPDAGYPPGPWSEASELYPPTPVVLPEPAGAAGLIACLVFLGVIHRLWRRS